jgi:hypothetical protein
MGTEGTPLNRAGVKYHPYGFNFFAFTGFFLNNDDDHKPYILLPTVILQRLGDIYQ